MKKLLLFTLLFLAFSLTFHQTYAQGCSDAGFCSLKYHTENGDVSKVKKNEFLFELTYGIGEDNVVNLTPAITYTRRLHKSFSWSNKITASYFNGNLGSIANVGDLYSTLNYAIPTKNKMQWNVLGGIKLPFTSGNDRINDKIAPMPYQSSLGTVDFLLGAALTVKKLEFTTALQLPLTKNNKNTYFKASLVDPFPSTNSFARKGDALLRVGYNVSTKNKKWDFKPNLLAIYHLGEDAYTNLLQQKVNIVGSEGLTLNANLIGQYNLPNKNSIGYSIASPLVIRDLRPDGLTRSLTVAVSYHIKL